MNNVFDSIPGLRLLHLGRSTFCRGPVQGGAGDTPHACQTVGVKLDGVSSEINPGRLSSRNVRMPYLVFLMPLSMHLATF